ncbi:MAG TPA: glycerophosphodiester phosphodiesterase family protein [Longimicrobiaceae bacterium]|nr:glycerophosphodiester phosphodiesterase family protein [Longimicrobiaceae bacterium]
MPVFPSRTLILGHRGAPLEAPENTFGAFRLALEHGADGVELDVQGSADGAPVVIHDLTLDRTTDGRGEVRAHTWARLAGLHAGPGEPLRRLGEVADWAAGAGAWLNVELKGAGTEEATLASLERAGVLERTLVSSFLPSVVLEVGRLAPGVRRALVTETWSAEVAALARDSGAGGVCIHRGLATAERLAELAAARFFVVVWTVDDPAEVRALLAARVAAIITNDPRTAVAVRDSTEPAQELS